MPHSTPDPIRSTRPAFGLVAWLEQTRVQLPLKGVECRFAVCGELLNVEMDQIFHQNTAQPLDCLYTFPLPGGAAVYRCEMHVNGRVVRAKVEEVEAARRLVRKKKAAGHRTALVEMERENLFTLSLGNVQPEDVIVVRFAYFQTLTRLEDWTSFQVPFCPGVRYIPGTPLLRAPKGRGVADDTDQVPDASRISPPRIDRLHPDAAYLSVEGRVENALGQVRDVSSPSHPVWVRDGEQAFTVSLAYRATVPDRDFVLRWTEAAVPEMAAMGWVCHDGQKSHALARLVAPQEAAASDDYAQDVYFLVDRSGSMEGEKWRQAARAFREFLKTLGPNDRVWATFFESTFQDLAEKPLSPARLLADASVQRLERLETGGGTELLPALQHVLEKVTKHSADRPAALLVITDGQIGNEAEVLDELRGHPGLRVHTFGIDTTVNDAFLKQVAAQQRGTCYLVTPNDDIVGAVARLGKRLRRPVLTSLKLDDGWQLADDALPDLHAGEVLLLPLAGPAAATEVTLIGRLADGTTRTYRFTLRPVMEPALRLLWARQRIDHLQRQGHRRAALALAKAANLICDGAAYVAWDEVQKVAVSAEGREVYQPVMVREEAMRYCVADLFDFRLCDVDERRDERDAVFYRIVRAGFAEAVEAHLAEDSDWPARWRQEPQFNWGDQGLSCIEEEIIYLLHCGQFSGPVHEEAWTRAVSSLSSGERNPQVSVRPLLEVLIAWYRALVRLLAGFPEAVPLVQALAEWAIADRPEMPNRTCALVRLLPTLDAAQPADRARLLWEWAEAHLQQPAHVRQSVLALAGQLSLAPKSETG